MHLDKVKAKTALLVSGKTQSDLADSLELSRRWVGAAFNGGNISEKKPAISLTLWACPWKA